MQKWFIKIAQKQRLNPSVVRETSAPFGMPDLHILGEKAILNRPKLALFCSVKSPGKLILEAYDLCQRLREQGITVGGGFHSPMEQECMRILLKSRNHVVWCLARGLRKRPSPEFKKSIADARLLMVTPFAQTVRRQTEVTCIKRNRVVAEMSLAVLVVHAAPGSKIAALCRELLVTGKPVYTFAHPANEAIIEAGALTIAAETDWRHIVGAGQ